MAIDPNWVRENPEEAARQMDVLSEERDQYRAAEEAQIALMEKAVEREQALAAHVERIAYLAKAAYSEKNGWTIQDLQKLGRAVIEDTPTTGLARRDKIKQAEALSVLAERKEKEAEAGDDAGLKSKCAYAAACAANESNKLRRQAEGGA